MKRKIYFCILAFIVFGLTDCAVNNSTAHPASPPVIALPSNKVVTSDNRKNTRAAETPLPVNDEAKKCQPSDVPLTDGIPPGKDMNETLPNDISADGLNNLLINLVGDFALAADQKTNFLEGDFNGDGCRDIAIIVGATDKYHDVADINQAASNTNIDVIETNLRTGAIQLPAEVKKRGAVMPKNLKAESDRALVIIHGGEKGWNWKYSGEGRIFLLLDSVFTEKDCGGCAASLVSRKSKQNGSECFPKTADGDGLFMGGEEGGKLIYFDGKIYKWTQCGD